MQNQQDGYPEGYTAALRRENRESCLTPEFVQRMVAFCSRSAQENGSVDNVINELFLEEIKNELEVIKRFIRIEGTPQPSMYNFSRPPLSIRTDTESVVSRSRQSVAETIDTDTPLSSAHPSSIGGYGQGRPRPPASVASSRGRGQNDGLLTCPSCSENLSRENTSARRHLRTCVKALVCSTCKKYRTGDRTRFRAHERNCGKNPVQGTPGRRNMVSNERPSIKPHCEAMCGEISKVTGIQVEHMISVIRRHYSDGCTDQNCRRNQPAPTAMQNVNMFTPQRTNAAALSAEMGHMGQWAGQELETTPQAPMPDQRRNSNGIPQTPVTGVSPLTMTPEETVPNNGSQFMSSPTPRIGVTDYDEPNTNINWQDMDNSYFDFNAMGFNVNAMPETDVMMAGSQG